MNNYLKAGVIVCIPVFIVFAIIATGSFQEPLKPVNASSEVRIIRVPESFGKTVAVAVYSTRVVILFEAGVHIEYMGSSDFQIVWEEA